MIVTTTDFIPNARILKCKDVIFSEQVISVNVIKDIVTGIKGLFGGSLEGYAEDYKTVREAAVADLKEQAKSLGGDGIIHLQVSYDQFVQDEMLCIAAMVCGTVVELEKEL